MMKAVLCTAYGAPDVLEIRSVAKPTPRSGEIEVKVVSTAVNSGDVRVRALRAEGIMKLAMRCALGFTKPRKPILGTVFAGVVSNIGGAVKEFAIGDQVFGLTGFRFGTHAEYVVVPAHSTVIHKPTNITFDEAAALPFGGQTAHYFLMRAGIHLRKSPKVLIIGATGSVGVAALQIARLYSADITAVCSEEGATLAQELGANRVVNYRNTPLSAITDTFSIVFDSVGVTSKKQCSKLLAPDGVFATVGGPAYASETREQLRFLQKHAAQGDFRAVIDRTYPLDQMADAHRYVDTGRKKGNVVIRVTE